MKTFSHTRPIRNEQGEIIGSKPSLVSARTIGTLPANFGTDRNKRLVLTCQPGDVISLRPEHTHRELTITAIDLYTHLIRCQANQEHLAKARDRKARKAARLAAQRQARAEKRLYMLDSIS